MGLDICVLGATKLVENGNWITVQAFNPVSDSDLNDAETWGEVAMFMGPVIARPYPLDDNGRAEGIIADGIPGHEGVIIGWRDTRVASVYGQLQPGDSALTGTGPNHESQIRCQEQSVSLVCGNDTVLSLDRSSGSLKVAVGGLFFEISKDNGIVATSANGQHGLHIDDSGVHLFGTLVLGGLTANPAMSIMLGPVAGSPGGPAAAPLVAAKGVFIGL